MNISLFKKGTVISHRKMGGEYVVLMTPYDRLVIEGSMEDAYMYEAVDDTRIKYVRPKYEMEDGRFTVVTKS